jgi:hypothetical protein
MSRARNIAALALATSMLLAAPASAEPKNELSLSAGIDSAFDGNVYNSRGPDFVNRIQPSVAYKLIDQRFELDSSYDFAYWTYAFGKAQNSINHRADLSLEGHPTQHTTLKVADEFSRAEDPGFLSRLGVVAPQIGIFDNIVDASAVAEFTRRLYGGIGYTYHWAQFDQYSARQAMEFTRLYDGAEHDVQGTFDYRVTRHDDLRFGGRAQLFTAGPQDGDANLWDIGSSYSPSVGWRHQFTRTVEWTADAGPLFYQRLGGSENIPGATNSGTTWRGATVLRWFTPGWRASVQYSHDLLGATGAGTALWADAVYGQVGYHWLEKFDAHVGGGYFRNGIGPAGAWSYDGVTVDTMVDYSVVNNFRIGAYYTTRWQQAGPGAFAPGTDVTQFPSTTRNIVGIRLLAVIGANARPPRREVKQ